LKHSFKKLLLLICIIIGIIDCTANNDIEISLLTCSPGTEIHSHFGHTGLRVNDKLNRKDIVYNFGLFDYNTPNFALRFIKGRLEYKLGIQRTSNFIRQYDYEQRAVYEQKLNLNSASKSRILDRLEFLYLPENRYYLYSFIKKNCSTEVRDLIFENDVQYENKLTGKSARDLINSYLKNNRWLRFGINLILGRFVDQELNVHQTMFLPDYLYNVAGVAQYNGSNLVKEDLSLNKVPKPISGSNLFSPLLIFSIIALLLFIKQLRLLRYVLYALFGITGVILLWLWFFSDHPELKNNFNLLWCNPLYLLYIPMAFLKKQNKVYIICMIAFLLIALLVWILNIQVFDIAVLPILVTLLFFNVMELLPWSKSQEAKGKVKKIN